MRVLSQECAGGHGGQTATHVGAARTVLVQVGPDLLAADLCLRAGQEPTEGRVRARAVAVRGHA
ncbi:hypothetical protein GCM10023340_08920 [Nocardioides marinquilinus]|uniref:Uncharacterized protein n=1 Tax=Nocardioides marinquilinus TaxID=1210400 RepID=A0ABP9PAN6_9ACTN